jgi:hypothetical protein
VEGGLPASIRSVIAGTAASGLAGALLGAAIGLLAPGFVLWVQSPLAEGATVPPVPFALGLGAACGLLLGALGCTLLACAHAWRGGSRPAGDGDGPLPPE